MPDAAVVAGTSVAATTRPREVSTRTTAAAGSRAGTGKVTRLRVRRAATSASNAEMTRVPGAATATPPVAVATVDQYGGTTPSSPGVTTARTAPAAFRCATRSAVGSPMASGAPV